ncbi:MAG TPA: hypothetical protein VIS76_07240 [Pseudomonadales bacterium]
MTIRLTLLASTTLLFASAGYAGELPRTKDGLPDLSGTYDIATITPLERPRELGENLILTPELAQAAERRVAALKAERNQSSDPNRGAPPAGGDGSSGAAGNVGGYNTFWIDNGDNAIRIDGRYRTSIITDPADGRRPAMTAAAQQRFQQRMAMFRENTGEAWWVGTSAPWPYDGPESRTLSDRCLLGFGSTGGPPMLPVLYNNVKRIVQTPDYVMILVEMVHDARIVRLNSEHADPSIRKWMGDSIGWWEGDTLVVDTTNFTDSPALGLATRDLHVVERFRRIDADTLLYSFTVDDPNTWTRPWSGEYPWPSTPDRLYEYACHEGNYAMEGMLKGARILEAEAQAGPGGQSQSGGGGN